MVYLQVQQKQCILLIYSSQLLLSTVFSIPQTKIRWMPGSVPKLTEHTILLVSLHSILPTDLPQTELQLAASSFAPRFPGRHNWLGSLGEDWQRGTEAPQWNSKLILHWGSHPQCTAVSSLETAALGKFHECM